MSSAAEEDSEYAEVHLATYFMYGIGTAKDERRAIAMLHRLSASGNGLASMNLLIWYREGTRRRKSSSLMVTIEKTRCIYDVNRPS